MYFVKFRALQLLIESWFSALRGRLDNFATYYTRLGKGNLIFCCTGSRENYFRSFGRQNNNNDFKGTLMQIWKFSYMFVFIQKEHTENFEFLILTILHWSLKFVFFLKSKPLFNIFFCLCMFVNKHFGNFTTK